MSAKRRSPNPPSASSGMDLAEIRKIIARSRPEDYDGHTEFARLSPQQRLEWLDAAVVFIESTKTKNRPAS